MSVYPHARYLLGAHEAKQFCPDVGAEVVFAGRSNSGKSSAINTIVQRHGLARTSKAPGQTQLVNFFVLEGERRLVDLPGYGFAKVPRPLREHWGRLLEQYFGHRESLGGLFLIVDARRGLGEQDEQLMAYAGGRGALVHVLLTKADKLGRSEAARTLKAARTALGARASAQLFSSTSKQGLEEARHMLEDMLGAKEKARRQKPVAGPD